MSGAAEKQFRQLIERLRLSILMERRLTDQERRLGLLMVERINRKIWDDSGRLESWMSVGTLADVMQVDTSRVKLLRRNLRAKGVLYISDDGGRGPGSTAVYGFSTDWLSRTYDISLVASGQRHAWERRRGPEVDAQRKAALAKLEDASSRVVPQTTLTKGKRVVAESTLSEGKGGSVDHLRVVRGATVKGGSAIHQNPLNDNPPREPHDLPSPLRGDGAAPSDSPALGDKRKRILLAQNKSFIAALRHIQGLDCCPGDLKAMAPEAMVWTLRSSTVSDIWEQARTAGLPASSLRAAIEQDPIWAGTSFVGAATSNKGRE